MKLRPAERDRLREWLLGSYGDWAGVRHALDSRNRNLSQSSLDRFFAGKHSDRTLRYIALLLGSNAEALVAQLRAVRATQPETMSVLKDPDAYNVALRIYVEMKTRKVALLFNPTHDLVTEIYNSWYAFFQVARNEIKAIPLHKDPKSPEMRRLFRLSHQILNDGLRPHLECWQARFRNWMAEAGKGSAEGAPQDAQTNFPHWKLLRDDLLATNQRLINYATALGQMVGQPDSAPPPTDQRSPRPRRRMVSARSAA
jgi:hypothetical protein